MGRPSSRHLLVRRVIASCLLLLVLLLLLALATGRIAYEVTNGVSMEPKFHTGDLVVVERARSYHVGEIVAYRGDLHGHTVILHRIVGGDSSGFIMKGDNNQSIDPSRPSTKDIIGRAVLHVPKVGAVLRYSGVRMLVAAAVMAAIIALFATGRSPVEPRPAGRRPGFGSLIPWKALLVGESLLLMGIGATFWLPGGTSARTALPVTQTGRLAYSAAVPVSATYPSGEVRTGDPVFLKLVRSLVVSFRYSSPAGAEHVRARMDVEISSASGWSDDVPLVGPTLVTGGGAALVGVLDLQHVTALATAVDEQTGVPTGTLDLTVVARVTAPDGEPSAPGYRLDLDLQVNPLEATLSGAAPVSTPTGPAEVSTTAFGPAPSPVHTSGMDGHKVRLGLIVLSLLVGAGLVATWPADPDPADEGPPKPGRCPRRPARHW